MLASESMLVGNIRHRIPIQAPLIPGAVLSTQQLLRLVDDAPPYIQSMVYIPALLTRARVHIYVLAQRGVTLNAHANA